MRLLDSDPGYGFLWEEMLESGGEFSVEELTEAGLGGKRGDKERGLLYINDYVPVRLLPLKLSVAVEEYHRLPGSDKTALRVLRSAYSIYRNTVNRSIEAPLVLRDGAWEWPEPVNCHWDDLETLLFMGMLMGADKRVEFAQIVTTDVGDVERSQDLLTGEVTEQKVAAIVARPQELIKYQIPRLADIRVVNSMAWQQHSNKVFANGLTRAIDDIEAGAADQGRLDSFFSFLFDELRGSIRMPVVRYASRREQVAGEDCGNLFILGF